MKNSFIIENLLQQKEGVRLEFKESSNIDAIAESITSFINTEGGDLVIGIDDNKNVLGVENAQQQSVEIQNLLVKSIKPTAPISIQVINYKKKDVILISVWEGAKKPYQYNGSIYNRIGKTTKATSPEKLSQLISERKQADFHWERMPVLGAGIEDLDEVEIKKTIKSYQEYRNDVNIEDVEDFLIRVGLLQNGNITNACMVLFGENPTRFIPQSRIRVTIYPSNISGDRFIDDKMFEGNIFKNITSIFEYLEIVYGKNLLIKGLERTEKSNYPVLAMREGILNAIVHRDYNSVKGFLQVSIYSDRTEISNYGALPDGLTIADLKTEHSSILRNPDIAQICFYRKYIEMLGTGTQRMIRDCKENKFKLPIWKQSDNVTTVIFQGVEHNRKEFSIDDVVNDVVNDAVNDAVKKGLIGAVNDVVNDVLIEIMKVLKNSDNGIAINELTLNINKSHRTIQRYIQLLRTLDLIEFRGAPKTGKYYLTDGAERKLK